MLDRVVISLPSVTETAGRGGRLVGDGISIDGGQSGDFPAACG